MTPDTGDWIVYTQNERARPRGSQLLGGPWAYAQCVTRGVDGWTAKPGNGSETFVMDREIVAVKLSRGEAIMVVDKLTDTQHAFIQERDALKPKFEQRIRDLLNA